MTDQAPLAGLMGGERKPGDPSQFGRIFPPDDAWLAKAPPEPVIDPISPSSTRIITCGSGRTPATCCPSCWPT